MQQAGPAAHRVAVFDLDGTLTRRDLYLAFLVDALRELGPARPARLASLPFITAQHFMRRVGSHGLKEAYLDAMLGGRSRTSVEQLAERFAKRAVARELKPSALAALARHRQQNDLLVLASASLDVYVEPIAGLLGFDLAVATRIAWTVDHRVAGTLDGPNLRGPAKLDAVQAELEARFAGRACCITAYSDHESDAALLAAASDAVAVDPTPAMARLAVQHGWRIADWTGRATARGTMLAAGAGTPAARS